MQNELKFATIGCDPELFLIDRKTNKIISAEGIIPGTKEDPFFISKDGHMIQLDNVLAEFGIPPSTTKESFIKNIHFVLDYLKKTYGSKYKISSAASAELDDKYLTTEHAQLFGCDPDWDVWQLEQNPSPKAKSSNLRSAGK